MNRQTLISTCKNYRYVLWREWDKTNPEYVLFVALNPSKANETEDDQTIRRCVDYAKRWGKGAMCMVNLFAYRETDPEVMKAYAEPIGADNDRWLVELANEAAVVVAAWGVHGEHLGRGKAVEVLLGNKLKCLKTTKRGYPRHPLYLKKTLEPVSLEDARSAA